MHSIVHNKISNLKTESELNLIEFLINKLFLTIMIPISIVSHIRHEWPFYTCNSLIILYKIEQIESLSMCTCNHYQVNYQALIN